MKDRRNYRLEPADETGWAFGLELHQLIICGCGVLAGTLMMSVVNVGVGAGCVIVGVAAGVIRIGGRTVVTGLPHAMCWIRFHRAGDDGIRGLEASGSTELGRKMWRGELVNIDPGDHGIDGLGNSIAIHRDARHHTYAATLRVHGHDFSLAQPGHQDQQLDQWATILEHLAAPQRANVTIHWTQHSRPHTTAAHERWLARHQTATLTASARHHYAELLAVDAAAATSHDTLLTITAHAPPGLRRTGGWHEETVELLCQELDQLRHRLTAAGVTVVDVLDDAAIESAIEERLGRGLAKAGAFAQRSGRPDRTSTSMWTHFGVGSVVHRSYEIIGWPRYELAASWMTELLHWNGPPHTIAIHLQPVPRSESHRRIRRDAAKIETDSTDRAARGFHVGAQHRRAAEAVHQREEELVAGHSEFRYSGVIAITAQTERELDIAGRELEQVAASIGIEFRPFHGQHAAGLQAVLPVGGTVR